MCERESVLERVCVRVCVRVREKERYQARLARRGRGGEVADLGTLLDAMPQVQGVWIAVFRVGGLLYRTVQRFRGGLVFKAHTLLYHSTLGLRVIK